MLELTFFKRPFVKLNNQPVTGFISEKVLALFAYIVLNPTVHSREHLATLLWGEMVDERAKANLRQALHNIQKLLPNALIINRKTVMLNNEMSFSLDVSRFDQAIDSSDLNQLTEAVSLYEIDLLCEFSVQGAESFQIWLNEVQEEYRYKLLNGLVTLVEIEERHAKWQTVSTLIQRILAIEPWHEEMHRRLMLTFARQRKYGAALSQYQTCCDVLANELGIEPMPDTTAVYEQIKALRQSPPVPLNVYDVDALVGREKELQFLEDWLIEDRMPLLAICGFGGSGKSSLALTFAQQQGHRFMDGVFYVPLADVTDAAFLDTAVASAINFSLPPQSDSRALLSNYFKERELLLVLDNVEHLQMAVQAQVNQFLKSAPRLKVLLTSREKPSFRSSLILPLSGLKLPDLAETAVVPSPATDLFIQQAQLTQPEFDRQAQWPYLVELCTFLQGIPLSIELAAAQLDLFDCQTLLAEIKNHSVELAVAFTDVPERHRSLRALFHHSWTLLSPEAKNGLANLTVFQGGATLAVAQEVAQLSQHTIRQLVNHSLILNQNGRLRFHPLIRQYAEEYLTDSSVAAQHAQYFSQWLQKLFEDGTIAQRQEAFSEVGNVHAMWTHLIHQKDGTAIEDVLNSFSKFFLISNAFEEGKLLMEQAVDLFTSNEPLQQTYQTCWGKLLSLYSVFLLRTGQLPKALELSQVSAKLLRQTNAKSDLGFTLNLCGALHIQSGQFETAVVYLQECAEIYRQTGQLDELIKPLVNLGSVNMRLGDHKASINYLTEALPVAKTLGDERGLMHILNNLGANNYILGDYQLAYQYYNDSLLIAERLNNIPFLITLYDNLSEITFKQEAWDKTIHYCQKSHALAREIDDQIIALRTYRIYGLTLYISGRKELAWAQFKTQIQQAVEFEAWPSLMVLLVGVGQLLVWEKEYENAKTLLSLVYQHPATEKQFLEEIDALIDTNGKREIEIEKAAEIRPLITTISDILNIPLPQDRN